ncbi:uncharacterized protein LOC112350854 [Selaginella moellendorffii]|uniref:uncharacterized protein LOC112350854 n=1 Tax=Selaginella moellendorffii TaxID=88036 RepID=UPI000D1C9E6C|nr:uncharacterized protein LOC112350854 [Selaginella moellendorffii]|eukprot:XP_024543586.1 uncharacterized protein LOC112350854 [Selaginella moellendorffii]
MGRWRKKPQMVLCAALGRGHMIPMMGLARSLASTGEISVTIVFQNAGARNSIQEATFFSGLDVELAVLDAANLCEDPPWLTGGSVSARMHKDRSRRSPKAAAGSMDPESALRELLADLLASPSPPVCLVADFSLPWTAAPARDLDLASSWRWRSCRPKIPARRRSLFLASRISPSTIFRSIYGIPGTNITSG